MSLADELESAAQAAAELAGAGERVTGVLAAEPSEGRRIYLCAFESDAGERSWLALGPAGEPVTSRRVVRDAASIAALCEVAGETAGGGDLEELRAQLGSLRLSERRPGIEEAERALDELQRVLGAPPRVASPVYLERVGAAVRQLEQALGEGGGSPFAEAMKLALGAVEALADEVEAHYRRPLE